MRRSWLLSIVVLAAPVAALGAACDALEVAPFANTSISESVLVPGSEYIAAKRSADAPQPVIRTRPLCPYPQTAHWKGAGSTDDAENFTCQ